MCAMPIASYFDTVQMNVPRTELIYEQWDVQARQFGDPRLLGMVEDGLRISGRVSALNTARLLQTAARVEDDDDDIVVTMDNRVRRLIKGIKNTEDYMKREGHSLESRVTRLAAAHCPKGPGDIISQRYEEKLHRIRALIAELRGPSADLIDALECERKLRDVEAVVADFAAALRARRKVTAADVRAVARSMHEQTLCIVAHIIAQYHGDAERFEALLLPFDDQQARIRAILKARRAGQVAGDDPSEDADDILDVEGAEGELGPGDEPPAEAAPEGGQAPVEAAPEAEEADGDPGRPPLQPVVRPSLPGLPRDADGAADADA